MKPIYLIVGCPGSGKTWVCEQLKKEFAYIPHDNFINRETKYVDFIIQMAETIKSRSMIVEAPFSISKIMAPLEDAGHKVICVFIQEPHSVIASRYMEREKKEIPTGHLSRQKTYAQRAKELGAFKGTAQQVLEHLKQIGSKE